MPSTGVALLYIGGTAWYAWGSKIGEYPSHQVTLYYLGLLLLIVPYYYQFVKKKRDSNFFIWLNWAIALSLTTSFGALWEFFDNPHWMFIGYIALFSVFYIVGRANHFKNKPLLFNPFLVVGTIGILIILFIRSFESSWRFEVHFQAKSNFYASPFTYITLGLLIAGGWLFSLQYKNANEKSLDPTALSGILMTLLYFSMRNMPSTAGFLINIWILRLAIFFIRKGAIRNHLGVLNFGLAIIGLLALCRFFDDQISFVWRGFFFLATGIAFFAGNYIVLKKRKITDKTY
jgi:hypothetical protein